MELLNVPSGIMTAEEPPPTADESSSWCIVCGNSIKIWDTRCPDMFRTRAECVGIKITYSLLLFGALKKPSEPNEVPSTKICVYCCLKLEETCRVETKLKEMQKDLLASFDNTAMKIWKDTKGKKRNKKKLLLVEIPSSLTAMVGNSTSGFKIVDVTSITAQENTWCPASPEPANSIANEASDSGIKILETMSLAADTIACDSFVVTNPSGKSKLMKRSTDTLTAFSGTPPSKLRIKDPQSINMSNPSKAAGKSSKPDSVKIRPPHNIQDAALSSTAPDFETVSDLRIKSSKTSNKSSNIRNIQSQIKKVIHKQANNHLEQNQESEEVDNSVAMLDKGGKEVIKPEISQFEPETHSRNFKQKRKNAITLRGDSNSAIYVSRARDLIKAKWSKIVDSPLQPLKKCRGRPFGSKIKGKGRVMKNVRPLRNTRLVQNDESIIKRNVERTADPTDQSSPDTKPVKISAQTTKRGRGRPRKILTNADSAGRGRPRKIQINADSALVTTLPASLPLHRDIYEDKGPAPEEHSHTRSASFLKRSAFKNATERLHIIANQKKYQNNYPSAKEAQNSEELGACTKTRPTCESEVLRKPAAKKPKIQKCQIVLMDVMKTNQYNTDSRSSKTDAPALGSKQDRGPNMEDLHVTPPINSVIESVKLNTQEVVSPPVHAENILLSPPTGVSNADLASVPTNLVPESLQIITEKFLQSLQGRTLLPRAPINDLASLPTTLAPEVLQISQQIIHEFPANDVQSNPLSEKIPSITLEKESVSQEVPPINKDLSTSPPVNLIPELLQSKTAPSSPQSCSENVVLSTPINKSALPCLYNACRGEIVCNNCIQNVLEVDE